MSAKNYRQRLQARKGSPTAMHAAFTPSTPRTPAPTPAAAPTEATAKKRKKKATTPPEVAAAAPTEPLVEQPKNEPAHYMLDHDTTPSEPPSLDEAQAEEAAGEQE